jgi:2-keto-4-pentenoate hydratase
MTSSPVWDDPRLARGMATQLAAREEQLRAGARPLGWKVAFGGAPAQESLGIGASVAGFLSDRWLIASGATCSLEGWTNPRLEPEIAIHMGAEGQIRGLSAAIELVDVDAPLEDLEALVATNVFHRGVILGPVDESRAGGDIAGITARIYRDGKEVAATDDPRAVVGDLVDVARHIGELLAATGSSLSEGDAIIAGSVVAPLAVAPGEHLLCDFGPLGELEIRFS